MGNARVLGGVSVAVVVLAALLSASAVQAGNRSAESSRDERPSSRPAVGSRPGERDPGPLRALAAAGASLGVRVLQSGGEEDQAGALQLLALANRDRAAAGLAPLTPRQDVADIALTHSHAMALAGDIWHNDAYFTSDTKRRLDALTVGENVAVNSSVDDAHARLMNSPGHRANLMSSKFSVVGIGVVLAPSGQRYITQNFVEPRPAAPPPPPTTPTVPAPPHTAPPPPPPPATVPAVPAAPPGSGDPDPAPEPEPEPGEGVSEAASPAAAPGGSGRRNVADARPTAGADRGGVLAAAAGAAGSVAAAVGSVGGAVARAVSGTVARVLDGAGAVAGDTSGLLGPASAVAALLLVVVSAQVVRHHRRAHA